MAFGLVVIGDEILSGKRQDKHFAKVVELLAVRGLKLAWARYLGDERPRLVQNLRETFACDDVVFSCGGIGATPDDHTRQAAAGASRGHHAARAIIFYPSSAPVRCRPGDPPVPRFVPAK